jgi:chemotaxis protein CheD
VKVADFAVGKGGGVLSTIGLGSCVAIVIYDKQTRVGGMAHVLLPSEGLSRDKDNRAKFPGTAVPLLLEEMKKLGARGPYTAKIAGGSSMFGALLPSGGINMGERNVLSSRQALSEAGIPLAAQDVGGDYGRSVYFHLDDGRMLVRSLKSGDRAL